MPQYITIKNFGPITSIEKMEVKDFMLFIGERATGKSTIAKLIWFFKTLDNVFVKVGMQSAQEKKLPVSDDFKNTIKTRLRNCFPGISLDDGSISYFYMQGVFIDINYSNDNIIIEFGSMLSNTLEFIARPISNYIQDINNSSTSLGFESGNQLLHFSISNLLIVPFKNLGQISFVPSQRSMWATLNGQTLIENIYLNEILESYSILTNYIKGNYKNILKRQTDGSYLNPYISKILNGELISSIKNERDITLKLNEGKEVEIQNSSSGQQDSIWILLVLMVIIHGGVIIEEPESGLDPKTQAFMTDAIIAYGNQNIDGFYNQIIITTHSPFILNTLGNILYASKLSKEHEDEREELAKLGFTSELLLDPERVAVYKCINGGVESIMEDGRVNNEEIDNVSSETLNILDSLIDIELKYENEV